ncbi:MAG: four-helix bundle copper-binding protein [Chitinophagaceae bacterium]
MAQHKNKPLLDALNNCAAECNSCAISCLDENDVKMLVKCVKLDIDCAAICTLVAGLIARRSEHGKHLLKECAEICKACADECDIHAKMGMEHCRLCAEACRACAKECEKMAALPDNVAFN